MKKISFIISLVVFILLTTACNGGSGGDSTSNNNTIAENTSAANDSALKTDYENALPVTSQLAIGTVKLDETSYPLTTEQIKTMLSLWKATRSLQESDTAASEEISAVFRQIEKGFTKEQLDTISSMQLTFQDMAATFQQMGLEFGGGGGRLQDLTPEQQATIQAARESGNFVGRGGFTGDFPGGGDGPGGGFGGGFPGGGPGGEGFGGLSPEQRATAIAERGGVPRVSAGTGINPVMLDMVINFLQGKVE